MKKQFILLSAAAMALVGCTRNQTKKLTLEDVIYQRGEHTAESYDRLDIKVVSPTGAPAVSLYSFASDYNDKFVTSSNPSVGVIPMFQGSEYDVIVAPTNNGLNQIINLGAKFKIAATITFGNFFLVSMGTDEDETLNDGDKVIIFQENGIPGKTFKYLYGNLNLTTVAVAAASDTKNIIEQKGVFDEVQYDYVLSAEPVVSATSSTPFIDIQAAFKEKTDGKLMTQASVFVRNDADKTKIDNFLWKLDESIKSGLATPDSIKTAIETVGSTQEQQSAFGVPGAMAKKVSLKNGFNLDFKDASSIKEDIKEFMGLIEPELKL